MHEIGNVYVHNLSYTASIVLGKQCVAIVIYYVKHANYELV